MFLHLFNLDDKRLTMYYTEFLPYDTPNIYDCQELIIQHSPFSKSLEQYRL